MDFSQLNEWLTLAANMGVLIGIIFIIIEIKQNTEVHKSDSRKALVSNDQASLLVALENVDIFQKMGEPSELSQADQYRLSFIFAIDLRNREFEYFQYQSGSLDEKTWESYKNLILMNHATERGRVWWDKIGRDLVNAKFGKMVDKMLKDHPADETWGELGDWDEGLSTK